MIVVVGIPAVGQGEHGPVAGGLASRIARAASEAGATVQLIGKVGDDPAGDAVLIDLARAGVGHAALLRDPAHPTRVVHAARLEAGDDDKGEPDDVVEAAGLFGEPEAPTEGAKAAPESPAPSPPAATEPGLQLEAADLELGLRYLVEYRVVVATEPLDERGALVVADAAAFAGAQVVALVAGGETTSAALARATVLEIPAEDPDGAFARLVAAYAVSLDGGGDPGEAFRSATQREGWEVARP